MDDRKTVHSIVLDAGPLLINQPPISTLLAKSEQLYTIPSVIAEIKDPVARSRLETTVMPFLTIRSPTPASMTLVSDFARKTGDLAVLSKPDLQVIALAYELECERNNGDWRLRRTPGQKGLNGSPPKAGAETEPTEDTTKTSQEANQKARGVLHPVPGTPSEMGAEDQERASDTIAQSSTPVGPESSSAVSVQEQLSVLSVGSTGPPENFPEVAAQQDLASETPNLGPSASSSESESNSEGWITPSNLKRHQQLETDKSTTPSKGVQSTLQVATLTTDYALQNTLLLMNLNLLSPSLSRISHLKSHILRCHACFRTTKEMTRQFCERCGMPTLTRVSCSTSANGEFKLHLKKNMQWNTRGDRYSVPKPVAGTSNGKLGKGGRGQGGKGGWGKELVLSEDQKEYTRALTGQERRREKDLMDTDYLPGILTGERSGGSRIRVGAGRTVNSKKR